MNKMRKWNRPTNKNRREKKVVEKEQMRRVSDIIHRLVFDKIKKLKTGPLGIRFVNHGELLESIERNRVNASEGVITDKNLEEIIKEGMQKGWQQLGMNTTKWKWSLIKLGLENEIEKIMKDLKHGNIKKEQIQERLIESIIKLTEDTAIGIDFESRDPKRITNVLKILNLPKKELEIAYKIFSDPNFISKNIKNFNNIIKTLKKIVLFESHSFTKRRKRRNKKDLRYSQYEVLLLLDTNAVHLMDYINPKEEYWTYLRPKNVQNVLGAIILTVDKKDIMGKILTATRNKPHLRMPIYNKEGKLIWPKLNKS